MSKHRQRRFTSLAELIDTDAESPLDRATFDDNLWLLLSERISRPADLARYDRPVAVYYASRYMQWEVENGGFAQAAYNIPDWFDLAAEAYLELEKPLAAALVRESMTLLPAELAVLQQKGLLDEASIARVFEHFQGSELAALDARIPAEEWWIDDQRVAYVRRHVGAFRGVR